MDPVDEHFVSQVMALPRGSAPEAVPRRQLLELFDAQLGSRHLDLAARDLGRAKRGFYSIGSSGHEGNAAVAAALRPTDPALLHYRSGAFYLARARQVPGQHPLRDVLQGITASSADPISGGRHKVFGNKALGIIPQTSTIASHLPRAVGLAFGIDRAKKLGISSEWPSDSVVVCSFGDASANHSTAVGAINSALHCEYRGVPMPLLLVCEDNGIGISVPTPSGWIEHNYRHRLRYFPADGTDVAETLAVATEAANWVRAHRRPAFLHLHTVRLMGHAGSDVESAYRRPNAIAADQKRDPLVRTAELLVSSGVLAPAEAVERYELKRREVSALADEVVATPKLTSAAAVMAPLAPLHADRVAAAARSVSAPVPALTLAQSINRALTDLLAEDPGVLVFGEDVAGKGGVYGVTRGLRKKFGGTRVFDTLLDEQTILGTGLGTALAGFLPIAEIQYLAYLHNAADQLRGEAATLQFFSNGHYRNPMIVRIAGYAYQKGFGGHFHNDNSLAALRDIPGLIIASPSRPDDAAGMLRTCAAAARVDGRVSVFLEPIALYHTRDLHEPGDDAWLADYPGREAPLGRARTYGTGGDLTIVTSGNGVPMSLRAARAAAARGIGIRVVDLRWLAPLPTADLLREARETGRVLVVDETRAQGGTSEAVLAALVDGRFEGTVRRVASENSFIPLGPAADCVLLSEEQIEKAVGDLLSRGH
ncbi:thiamine pyrophosphate-dependent enzyme [Amycolatopsis jejuensis]|uniref:thiamine pyrophosphate-dependent enzyme n=1 Tax=Amycolatopsis jejuensis TaxID=330084 RepID=UPI000523F757|nr:thiamine pyrophosphate-dependent enzyme [Amycolatopsis jejuensis]